MLSRPSLKVRCISADSKARAKRRRTYGRNIGRLFHKKMLLRYQFSALYSKSHYPVDKMRASTGSCVNRLILVLSFWLIFYIVEVTIISKPTPLPYLFLKSTPLKSYFEVNILCCHNWSCDSPCDFHSAISFSRNFFCSWYYLWTHISSMETIILLNLPSISIHFLRERFWKYKAS